MALTAKELAKKLRETYENVVSSYDRELVAGVITPEDYDNAVPFVTGMRVMVESAERQAESDIPPLPKEWDSDWSSWK